MLNYLMAYFFKFLTLDIVIF